MAIKTFAVEAEGVGRPAYMVAVTASKPAIVENQEQWTLQISQKALASGTYSTDTYTVPEGYKLNLGGAIITCSSSCIQKLILYAPGNALGDYLYDMRGDILFGALSSFVIAAGQMLTVYIYNNDSVARDFSLSMVGMLERVS